MSGHDEEWEVEVESAEDCLVDEVERDRRQPVEEGRAEAPGNLPAFWPYPVEVGQ